MKKLVPFTLLILSNSLFAQTRPVKSTSETEKKGDEQTKTQRSPFPIGPYRNGKYCEPIGEEKEAEEAILQEEQDVSRVNKIGPNKR